MITGSCFCPDKCRWGAIVIFCSYRQQRVLCRTLIHVFWSSVVRHGRRTFMAARSQWLLHAIQDSSPTFSGRQGAFFHSIIWQSMADCSDNLWSSNQQKKSKSNRRRIAERSTRKPRQQLSTQVVSVTAYCWHKATGKHQLCINYMILMSYPQLYWSGTFDIGTALASLVIIAY